MSTYKAFTLNPKTKKWEHATWHDDYFAHHHYGVEFEDGTVIDPDKVELETREPTEDERLRLNNDSLTDANNRLTAENEELILKITILKDRLAYWDQFAKMLRDILNDRGDIN